MSTNAAPSNIWELQINALGANLGGLGMPGHQLVGSTIQHHYRVIHCFAKSLLSILNTTDKGGSAGASTLNVNAFNLNPADMSFGTQVVNHTQVTDGSSLPAYEEKAFLDTATSMLSTLLVLDYNITGPRTWGMAHYLIGKM